MTITFSLTGRGFTPGNSSYPESDCYSANKIEYARRSTGLGSDNTQVVVTLDTDQARSLVEQLIHDYPYLLGDPQDDPIDIDEANEILRGASVPKEV